jgi:hypothetical protein
MYNTLQMFFILNTKSPDYFLDSDKYVCSDSSETIVALLTVRLEEAHTVSRRKT